MIPVLLFYCAYWALFWLSTIQIKLTQNPPAGKLTEDGSTTSVTMTYIPTHSFCCMSVTYGMWHSPGTPVFGPALETHSVIQRRCRKQGRSFICKQKINSPVVVSRLVLSRRRRVFLGTTCQRNSKQIWQKTSEVIVDRNVARDSSDKLTQKTPEELKYGGAPLCSGRQRRKFVQI